jgi:hypothetical protein
MEQAANGIGACLLLAQIKSRMIQQRQSHGQEKRRWKIIGQWKKHKFLSK